jgi:hypothetical protein
MHAATTSLHPRKRPRRDHHPHPARQVAAQTLYGMTIHAFVFLSTHAHFLLSPSSAGHLAKFMQFVNANIAKEAGSVA